MDKTEKAAIVAARIDEIVCEENERLRAEVQPILDELEAKNKEWKARVAEADRQLQEAINKTRDEAVLFAERFVDNDLVRVSHHEGGYRDPAYVRGESLRKVEIPKTYHYGYQTNNTIRPQDIVHILMQMRNSTNDRVAKAARAGLDICAGKSADIDALLEM